MRQQTAFWSIFNRNYLQERVLNATLLNNIVAALARPTVMTQEENIPFPREQRFYGRADSQGNYYTPQTTTARTPTDDWGHY